MDRPFAAYQGDEPYIFVSYSHENSDVVYPEIQWLKDQGFNIWYDEGISPGSEWHQDLADHIQESALFVYFITPRSVISENCQREVHFAIDHSKQLLAVHLEETELPSGVDLSLSSMQAIMRHELSDLDYRIKLLNSASDHIKRGIGVVAAQAQATNGVSWKVMAVISLAIALASGFIVSWWTPASDGTVLRGGPVDGSGVRIAEWRLSIALPTITLGGALSPDGSTGVYADPAGLWLRRLDRWDPVLLDNTEGASLVFWSPDGRSLGYRQDGDLKRINIASGIIDTIAAMPNPRAARDLVGRRPNPIPAEVYGRADGGARFRYLAAPGGHREGPRYRDGRTLLCRAACRTGIGSSSSSSTSRPPEAPSWWVHSIPATLV